MVTVLDTLFGLSCHIFHYLCNGIDRYISLIIFLKSQHLNQEMATCCSDDIVWHVIIMVALWDLARSHSHNDNFESTASLLLDCNQWIIWWVEFNQVRLCLEQGLGMFHYVMQQKQQLSQMELIGRNGTDHQDVAERTLTLYYMTVAPSLTYMAVMYKSMGSVFCSWK